MSSLSHIVLCPDSIPHRERYRDLIDAADSIVELQTGSHQVFVLMMSFVLYLEPWLNIGRGITGSHDPSLPELATDTLSERSRRIEGTTSEGVSMRERERERERKRDHMWIMESLSLSLSLSLSASKVKHMRLWLG